MKAHTTKPFFVCLAIDALFSSVLTTKCFKATES
eukprot:Nitzschia sp. Nitz4//scaffold387_size12074//2710//2924//NITZ4_009000-RA/size12074-exonerate_est2genome-gene-0.2-mRNA-1//-1//CDS//3329549967//2498//frame0